MKYNWSKWGWESFIRITSINQAVPKKYFLDITIIEPKDLPDLLFNKASI